MTGILYQLVSARLEIWKDGTMSKSLDPYDREEVRILDIKHNKKSQQPGSGRSLLDIFSGAVSVTRVDISSICYLEAY
jgi:hypothetical protein